jgi:hypothetical protein
MKRTIFALVLFGLASPAFGQGVDPIIGAWKLNLEKSTSTFPPFKSVLLTFTGEGQNRTLVAEGIDANSQPFKIQYSHIYDGQPHPTTGTSLYDSSTYTRIGNTINIVRFRNAKPVIVSQSILIPGKTYTVTEEGIDLSGQLYHSVGVYDRQ